jgi:sugar transferase (PEP-CTERM/EpsH1 system associated)
MHEILFLAHRLPFPPDKGDKIRSYHLLRHLARTYRVHVGSFIDTPDDVRHLPALRALAGGEVYAPRLSPRLSRLRSLGGLLTARSCTEVYYAHRGMAAWVQRLLRARPVRHGLVFSAAMAQYLLGVPDLRRVLDLVDVDSEKWRDYAAARRGPAAAFYRREARHLLAFERRAAADFDATLLVSGAEADLFRQRAPEVAHRVTALSNGVDTAFFDPALGGADPYAGRGRQVIVFTGAMDYWPNAQAVVWFAGEVLPRVRQAMPDALFYVVGRNPGRAVRQLSNCPGVTVTGTVPDVRPYLAHAAVAVAPLQLARGIQNKVLEAMAMALPVVASPQALEGIAVRVPDEALMAVDADAFARQVAVCLNGHAPALGGAARRAVLREYAWETRLRGLDALLGLPADSPAPAEACP